MMQLTIFAILYIPILIASLCIGSSAITGLLLITTILQATSVINLPVGERSFGISPYNFTALAASFWLFFGMLRGQIVLYFGAINAVKLPLGMLFGYVLVAFPGAMLLPRIFSGTEVFLLFDPYPMDVAPGTLRWTISNLVQLINLCVHLMVLLFFLMVGNGTDRRSQFVVPATMTGLALVLGAGFWERISLVFGASSGNFFWVSNQGYYISSLAEISSANLMRIGTPFSEPSYASTYLAATTVGLFAVLAFGQRWRLALCAAIFSGLGLVNTFGATGWAAAGVALIVLALWLGLRGICTGQTVLRHRAMLVWSGMFVLTLMMLWLTLASPWAARANVVFDNLIWSKLNFDPNEVRHQSNLLAFKILRDTMGLGVGLGSNRSSSFFTSLLSNTGVAGAVLFCGMLVSLLWHYWRAPWLSDIQIYTAASLATATLAVGLGIPDLNLPMYWGFIFMAFICCPQNGTETASRIAMSKAA